MEVHTIMQEVLDHSHLISIEMDGSFHASKDFSATLYFDTAFFFLKKKVSGNPKYQPEDTMNFYLFD